MPDRTPGSRLRRGALGATVAALGLTLVTAGPAAAAPTVGDVDVQVTPTATAGGTVDVRLDLLAVGDVFAYETTLAFDPALLALDAVTGTPGGGFDDVASAPGTVTLRHSRLGTSPALAGDVTPTTLRLRALAAGTTPVTVRTVTVVGADAVTASRTDAASATVVLAAAPVAVPDPVPGATPPVAPAPADGAGTPAAPTATPPAAAAPRGPRAGALSDTGAQVGGLVALAVAALATGTVLVRRRVVSAR